MKDEVKITVKDVMDGITKEMGEGDLKLDDEIKRAEELEILSRTEDNRKKTVWGIVRDIADVTFKGVSAVGGIVLGGLWLKSSNRLADLTTFIESEGVQSSRNWARIEKMGQEVMKSIRH